MGKMTAEQEARYALDWDLPPENLHGEARVIYDRLKEELAKTGALAEPVPDWQLEGGRVLDDAKNAVQQGLPVFVARIPQGVADRVTGLGFGTAGLLRVSSVVAQVEALGWRVELMSWAPSGGGLRGERSEGFFLFRRTQTQEPAMAKVTGK